MKIYADPAPYDPARNRYWLSNILKILWNELTPAQRLAKHGSSAVMFEAAPSIESADICLLTMQWNYYVDHALTRQAAKEVELARHHHKPLVVFCSGDSPANLPFGNLVLFEAAGCRSTPGLAYHSGEPRFLPDYIQHYCGGELHIRQKSDIPVIGFCGQADPSPLRKAVRSARLRWRQILHRAGIIRWQPPPFETTSFRARVLRQFENQSSLKTNFIVRQRYQAGSAKHRSDSSPARMEFIHNILNSDYTLCMRGGGNYSLRFYEALALGRIPVFIDTDCLLPFEDKIPYRSLFPWVSHSDLPRAAEIVTDFHRSLSNTAFVDLQRACLALSQQHFTTHGFHRDFVAKMKELC